MPPSLQATWDEHDRADGHRSAREGVQREQLSPARCAGAPDEVATSAALLMGPEGAFITGSDFLMDGGVTASSFYGELAPE
jgi:NAD(P)-dependent dehydrogenase (short-subunit alcohol dehydrogenase family)